MLNAIEHPPAHFSNDLIGLTNSSSYNYNDSTCSTVHKEGARYKARPNHRDIRGYTPVFVRVHCPRLRLRPLSVSCFSIYPVMLKHNI